MSGNGFSQLSTTIQEGLVSLLFYDDTPTGAKLVRALVPPAQFDGEWKAFAQAASAYLDKYGVPPLDETPSVIETLLARLGEKNKANFLRCWDSLQATRGTGQKQYWLDSASTFARYQRINAGITAALSGLEKQNDEGVAEAETAIAEALKGAQNAFDVGTNFVDPVRALAFLEKEDEAFSTGIKELDLRNLGPSPGTLHLFGAPAKMGKSWWLINLAKRGHLAGKTVVYISLEMSEALVTKRLFQTFFAITKRQVEAGLKRARFDRDPVGRFVDFSHVNVSRRPSLSDVDIRKVLLTKQRQHRKRATLIIKQFPTGDLTLRGLSGYLDGLESQGIVPQLLLVDYADLMEVDPKHKRESLSAIYTGLRGLAVKRQIAIATATQTNRASMRAGEIDVYHLAEDIGKVAIADTLLLYMRTDAERDVGAARLLVAAAREDADRLRIVLSQNYEIGQFALDSALFSASYESRMNPQEDE